MDSRKKDPSKDWKRRIRVGSKKRDSYHFHINKEKLSCVRKLSNAKMKKSMQEVCKAFRSQFQ
jgi:hypothetical protein